MQEAADQVCEQSLAQHVLQDIQAQVGRASLLTYARGGNGNSHAGHVVVAPALSHRLWRRHLSTQHTSPFVPPCLSSLSFLPACHVMQTLLLHAFVQRGQQLLPQLQSLLSQLRQSLEAIKARCVRNTGARTAINNPGSTCCC